MWCQIFCSRGTASCRTPFGLIHSATGTSFLQRLLTVLIALHVAGALYHTFIRRDRLLGRMWFGKRAQAGGPASLDISRQVSGTRP
jgi:hypothetical protein